MASLINPPLLDKTGKEIVAALTGEEVQPSASQINAPISDATGKAILAAIKQGGGGGGGTLIVDFICPIVEGGVRADYVESEIPAKQIEEAYKSGTPVLFRFLNENTGWGYDACATMYVLGRNPEGDGYVVNADMYNVNAFLNYPSVPFDPSDETEKIRFNISSD